MSYSKDLRIKAVTRMIGQKVYVTKLATPNPKEVQYDGLYVPLPEYGISLWMGEFPAKRPDRSES